MRSRHASFALCLAAALLWASDASARTERFRWTQTNASTVNNFRIYWGAQSGSYTSSRDLGVPTVDAQGAFVYDLVVPDSDTIYVAVTAWTSGLESTRSNERVRAGITGGTPPPPPPPPSGASAAIVGFALWNAQADTVLDASFQNGETIPADVSACAAIEIKTNAYLQAEGPGSVKKVFDGHDPGCTGDAVEDLHPYGWEDGDGVGFECATSLAEAGNHTLTVTPYDGDDCSGLAGTPMSVSFTVSAPPAPPAGTLGAPGKPYIVQ